MKLTKNERVELRTSRPSVLEGMQSAHVYKDSLRWKQQSPNFALLLVPRGGSAAWLESNDFRMRHGVGVVELGVESDVGELIDILRKCLHWTTADSPEPL
jgi:hypothetical protein